MVFNNQNKLANKSNIPMGTGIAVFGPDGREIALFNIDGVIYALDNYCPHMGGPLAEGKVEDCIVTCPWHGWRFDVRNGMCENYPGEDAASIELEICEDEIFLKTRD